MKAIKITITACCIFSLSILIFTYYSLNKSIGFEDDYQLTVKVGAGFSSLISSIDKTHGLACVLCIKAYTRLSGDASNIKAGDYLVDSSLSVYGLIDQVSDGKVIQQGLTFIEGWRWRDYLDAVNAEQGLRQDVTTERELLDYLKIESDNIEGWLAPETYFFASQSSAKIVLRKAYLRQKKILEDEWENRDPGLPYKTPYEALIMASIIEKETGVAFERPAIAGVFVRRLNKPMRLQTDPTVIYGLGENYRGNITRKHLKTPTAYNTYTMSGLPPTPIAMPSKAAIHAALHPAEGSTLYFVAKGNGEHYFSTNLDEHNKAVRKYQLRRTQTYHSAPVAN